MKKETQLLINRICELRKRMKAPKFVAKFVGAVPVEILRQELIKKGFNISQRDVFIEEVPYELDLLILKKRARAQKNLLCKPNQVKAVLEIKFIGVFRGPQIKKIRKVFNAVKKIDKKIKCIYLVISKYVGSKYRLPEEKLGDSSFTLMTRTDHHEKVLRKGLKEAIKKGDVHITGDWDRLIKFLKDIRK